MAYGESMKVSLLSRVLLLRAEISTVDYVVFATANVTLEENPNEVSATKYVSKDELEALFQDECEFSPQQQRHGLTRDSLDIHTLVQAHC